MAWKGYPSFGWYFGCYTYKDTQRMGRIPLYRWRSRIHR